MDRTDNTQAEVEARNKPKGGPTAGAVRRFNLFSVVVALAAGLFSMAAAQDIPVISHPWQWGVLGTLIAGIVISEFLAVTLPNGSSGVISMSYPLAVAVFVFF